MTIRWISSARPIVACLAVVAGSASLAAHAQTPADAPPVADTIIHNVRVFDGHRAALVEDAQVRVSGNKIVSVGRGAPDSNSGATVIDGGGRVLIPGLIDAHAHLSHPVAGGAARDLDPSYVAALSTVEARNMLMRGFTTVRDASGPVFGLKRAIDEGVIDGPRIFPSGAMVSQTSGHADSRLRTSGPRRESPLDHMELAGYGAVADGVEGVLAAVREQLRLGATQIKVSAGGGISSVYDPLDSIQYTADELRAAVAAAADWGTYVTVHAYTPEAIRRSIEAGVRSIEHGHLIDEPTMKLMAERGVYLSPQAFRFSPAFTSTPRPQSGGGANSATAEAARAKGAQVRAGLDRMMTMAKRHRVKVALGTDLFGSPAQFALAPRELGARLKWFSSAEVLEQATGINGELLGLSGPRNAYGKVGVIEAGALADLLIVEGNPLEDVRVLEDAQRHLKLIMKDGRVFKNAL